MLICLSDQTYRLETPTNTNDLLLVEMLSTVNHIQKKSTYLLKEQDILCFVIHIFIFYC